jgi:two-component system NtrC family sensor kinase
MMNEQEKVLMIDDEEGLRYVFSRQLRSAGYAVETAENGLVAVEKMREQEYGVIVTDMKMPKLDGMGVIQHAKKLLPEAELIVLTGHGSLENALEAFKTGNVFEYLLKPLEDISLLDAVVGRAFERRRLRRHNRQLFDQLQQAYEELKQKSEQLIQTEKMSSIGQLAAGVAHELNNPLTAVIGFTQYLEEKLGKQPLTELNKEDETRMLSALQNVIKGAHRCRDIVASLLRFSRATHKGIFSQVDINTVLTDSFVFTEHMLLRNGIVLEKSLAHDLPVIQGNAARLQHVFTNLILNAQQATESGGRVTVTSEAVADPSGVLISVSDTGYGIPKENLERIFEPFFTSRPDNSGTGLGLSIVKQIVQEHNGRIEVESEIGKGSCFRVYLPTGTLSEVDVDRQVA